MSKWEYLTKPGPKYLRMAKALAGDNGFGLRAIAEAPEGGYVVDIQVRYLDKRGRQVGDTMGFELLTPAAHDDARRRGDIISQVSTDGGAS